MARLPQPRRFERFATKIKSLKGRSQGLAKTITYDKGRWFIQVQQLIELNTEIQGEVRVVGIDQGVRTFATCFSQYDALIVSNNFAKEKLFPIMRQVDKLIGQKQKILNKVKGVKFLDMPQWAPEMVCQEIRQARVRCGLNQERK